MRFIVLLILLSMLSLRAAPSRIAVFSVPDDYYGDLLLSRDSIWTVGNRISYPGLFRDTSQVVGIGFLSPTTTTSSNGSFISAPNPRSTSIQSNDLYGWTELNSRFGRIGAWVGNLSIADDASNTYDSRLNQQFSGHGAIWWSPTERQRLDGVSFDIGRRHSYDSTYARDRTHLSWDVLSGDTLYATIRTLIALEGRNQLRLSYSGHFENSIDDEYRANLDSTGSEQWNDTQFYKFTNKYRYLTVGLINNGNRQVNVGGVFTTTNLGNYANTGQLGWHINASTAAQFTHAKHALRCGLYGSFSVLFSDSFNIEPGISDIFRNSSTDDVQYTGMARFPIIVDVNLFGSKMYCILNITPEISGRYWKKLQGDKRTRGHSFALNIRQLSLGLRGRVGEKLEFYLAPSLQSNIFFAGLEVQYFL